jgi:NAD+ kinase
MPEILYMIRISGIFLLISLYILINRNHLDVYNKHMTEEKTFALVIRPDETSQKIAETIRRELLAQGYHEQESCPHTVFVIGGDGTFIIAVHKYMTHLNQVRFYGIHTGTLGFYTDFRDSDLEEFMDVFLQNRCEEITYPLLKADMKDHEAYAINEIRIENVARTQVMEIYVNGEKFEDFRGTGICVCTQLGSTAYNRSLGGAVIQEGLHFIEMTEISGIHHVKYRSLGSPIVMCDKTVLTFKSESFEGAVLGVDSDVLQLHTEKEIRIGIAPHVHVRMLRGRKVNYFSRLQSLF